MQAERLKEQAGNSSANSNKYDFLPQSARKMMLAFTSNIEYMLPTPGSNVRQASSEDDFNMQGKPKLQNFVYKHNILM